MKRGQNEDLRKANTIDWSERWGVGGDGLLDESLLARASNFLNYETKFGYKGCFVFIPHSLRGKILTNIDADDPRVSFPFESSGAASRAVANAQGLIESPFFRFCRLPALQRTYLAQWRDT
jgi:hypothetical protein